MRKDTTEFREELVRKHLRNDNTVNWVALAEEYTKETGIPITPKRIADNLKRIAKRVKKEDEQVTSDKGEQIFKEDGTIIATKVLKVAMNENINESMIMEKHGFDSNEWICVKAVSNFWGCIDGYNNYQTKIEVKPRKPHEFTEEILTNILANVKPCKPIEYNKFKSDEHMLLDLADIHIGVKQSRESRIKEAVESARELILDRKPKSMTIAFMGDYLHVANEHELTSKGTQIKTSMTPYEMFDKAFELSRYIIERLSIFPLHIVFVEGNHSRVLEYSLFKGLTELFSKSKHITFDTGHKRRKAVLLGKTLIGFEHGDMNKKNKFDWLQVEHKKLWAQADYYEIHEGHIHTETVETKGAVTRRTVTTIKEQDQYEYNEGYMKARNAIQLFTYNNRGLRSIEYV